MSGRPKRKSNITFTFQYGATSTGIPQTTLSEIARFTFQYGATSTTLVEIKGHGYQYLHSNMELLLQGLQLYP